MKFRDLSVEELFPHAIRQDLLDKQSVYFVNQSLTEKGVGSIYKDIPTELILDEVSTPLIIDSKSPRFFVDNYLKNHWRMILLSIIIGGVLIYSVQKSSEKRSKKNHEMY